MMLTKTALVIINPVAGTKRANRFLTDIIQMLSNEDYQCQVQATMPQRNATFLAKTYAPGKDLVICIGGDGTLNETIAGCIAANVSPKIGYIPAGSTNDFANNLGLNAHPIQATKAILNGKTLDIDVGMFNDRVFIYTASFGAFTRASYSAPREWRNSLGHLAYVLAGAQDLGDLKAHHVKIKTADRIIEGEYIFGGICNSTRIGGGMIKLPEELVNINDGLLEVVLVKYPETAADFTTLIFDLVTGNYASPFLDFLSTPSLDVIINDNVDWTIDGEYQKGCKNIHIDVLPGALKLQY